MSRDEVLLSRNLNQKQGLDGSDGMGSRIEKKEDAWEADQERRKRRHARRYPSTVTRSEVTLLRVES